jgi:hypothetical protein
VSPGGLWDWGGEFFVVGRFAKTHRNAGNQFCCKATERNGGRIHPKFSPIRQNKFDGENLLYNALKPNFKADSLILKYMTHFKRPFGGADQAGIFRLCALSMGALVVARCWPR